jgi:hypothetical protein
VTPGGVRDWIHVTQRLSSHATRDGFTELTAVLVFWVKSTSVDSQIVPPSNERLK